MTKGRKEFRKDAFIGTKREHSETVARIFLGSQIEANLQTNEDFND